MTIRSLPFCRTFVLAAAVATGLSGCRSSAPDDAALATALNTQLRSDPAINMQPIQGFVQGGVATLSGSVLNDAQKTIALRDASGIHGIRSVINNLQVGTLQAGSLGAYGQSPAQAATQDVAPAVSAAVTAPPPPRERLDESRKPTALIPKAPPQQRRAAPIQRSYANSPASGAPLDSTQQPLAVSRPAPAPMPQAPPPPQPVFRNVSLPAGTTLPVRITQTLDSATTEAGESFSGTIVADVMVGDQLVLPAGTSVTGRVDAVQEAAHFKGNSLLTVSLTGVRPHGSSVAVTTDPYTVQGKGRGKNTAEKTGGGAAVGAILGGIFGGGKGAAIGAVTGGGVGAGSNAITRGQQVQIASETVVRFHTDSPVTVRVRSGGAGRGIEENDPSLQRRPND